MDSTKCLADGNDLTIAAGEDTTEEKAEQRTMVMVETAVSPVH